MSVNSADLGPFESRTADRQRGLTCPGPRRSSDAFGGSEDFTLRNELDSTRNSGGWNEGHPCLKYRRTNLATYAISLLFHEDEKGQ